MINRAERRYQKHKKQQKAQKLYPDKKNAKKFADHLAICSCFMCGNPRKYTGEKTTQEKREMQDVVEDFL